MTYYKNMTLIIIDYSFLWFVIRFMIRYLKTIDIVENLGVILQRLFAQRYHKDFLIYRILLLRIYLWLFYTLAKYAEISKEMSL